MIVTIQIVYGSCCEKNKECIIAETCQDAACGNCSITVYNNSGALKIPQSNMNIQTPYIYTYNASSSLWNMGVYPYTINCTNNKVCQGDCQVEVKRDCEGGNDAYYLYIVVYVIFFILLGLGYYLKEGAFVIIAGMLSIIMAINLFMNGFPTLTNLFLKNSVVIILAGIGFYFVLIPSLEYIEGWS